MWPPLYGASCLPNQCTGLLSYKSMYSQMLISGFDKQHSMETDDEDTLPQRQSRIYPVVSEEQVCIIICVMCTYTHTHTHSSHGNLFI